MTISFTFFSRFCTGRLPGPVLFGFAIDHSCLLWEKKCDGSTGACLYYDNHDMAWLLFAVCAACKVLNIVFGLFSWRLYKSKLRKGDLRTGRLEHTLTVGETGNGPTGSNVESTADQASGVSSRTTEAESTGL